MRVAILTGFDSGLTRGISTTIQAVLHHAPIDIEPRVYPLGARQASPLSHTFIPVRSARVPLGRPLRLHAPSVEPLARRLAADQVGAIHFTSAGAAGLMARALADRLDLPLIGSYETALGQHVGRSTTATPITSLLRGYVRWLYSACDWILVPSETTRAALEQSGWCRERLVVCRRGVDGTIFSPARRSAAVRRHLQISDARPALLYSCSLRHDKSLAMLIRLKDLLNAHSISHRFVLIGPPAAKADVYRRLPDAVFIDQLDRPSIGEVMASADLFISPIETETGLLEAQASGLPVLVALSGCARESVVDGETGYLCTAGDERDFCWRIAQLLSDTRKRAVMGEAARAHALRRGWAEALQPLFNCYREAWHQAAFRRTPSRVTHRAILDS